MIVPSKDWKLRDATSYTDAIAECYDRWVSVLSAPLAAHICERARLEQGQRVLDVGCGSGVATRAAAAAVGASGSVTGVDFSPAMIAVARASRTESQRTEYLHMDAEALDLPDESFDAVISLCAVAHFPDNTRALREMKRVLKTGGRLVISFGYARPTAPVPLVLHSAKRVLQRVNVVQRRVQAPSSLMNFIVRAMGHPERGINTEWSRHQPHRSLMKALRSLNMGAVERTWCGHEVEFQSADDFADAQLAICTEVRKGFSSEAAEAIVVDYRRSMRRARDTGAKLIYPYGAQFISATKL
ncbi:MAG: methyltransferase domain-containing protein [Gemmatimonadaceae bacterium]